ncbi:MAG: cytochrome C, partial [Candidatus Krumholzibacteria bacterium]|nr:cytochrome C [Candidatus Krumholzibacteria bacterium]
RKIPWAKVYRVPSHVYFSHRRHATLGQIECATCHGNVEEMTEPFARPHAPISMNKCMECHDRNGVDNECTRCHR